jgi:hypothetical protein
MIREAGFSPHAKCYNATLNILRNARTFVNKKGGLRGVSPFVQVQTAQPDFGDNNVKKLRVLFGGANEV